MKYVVANYDQGNRPIFNISFITGSDLTSISICQVDRDADVEIFFNNVTLFYENGIDLTLLEARPLYSGFGVYTENNELLGSVLGTIYIDALIFDNKTPLKIKVKANQHLWFGGYGLLSTSKGTIDEILPESRFGGTISVVY
jgi:hypothetical protein